MMELVGGARPAASTPMRATGFTTTVQRSGEIGAFETVVRQAASEKAAANAPAGGTAATPEVKNAKARKSFEAFALQVFIGSMLPKENAKMFGTGSAGKLWQSLLAEKLADQIASSGRLKLLPDQAIAAAPADGPTIGDSVAMNSPAPVAGRRTEPSGETR